MTPPSPPPGWYPDPSGASGQRYWDGQKWGPKAPEQQQPHIVINNTNTVAIPTWGQQFYPPAVVYNGGKPTKAGNIILVLVCVGLSAFVLLAVGSSHPIMLIPLVVLAVGGFLGYRHWRREEDRRAEQAKIAARADAEYRASLKGDPMGTYGQYPPPPLPEPDQWPPPSIQPGA